MNLHLWIFLKFMSPVKFHLAGEIALNENLFVGIKTLKLTAPSLP